MKVLKRLKDRFLTGQAPGIKTKYPLPFSIELCVNYIIDDLNEDEESALRRKDYSFSFEKANKVYGPERYSKRLIIEFLSDTDFDTPPWYKGDCYVNLIPNNISNYGSSTFITSLFHSINNVLSVMSPFWFYHWDDPHHDDILPMMESFAGENNIDMVKHSSDGKIMMLKDFSDGDYEITLGPVYNHPSMVLSGISIIQAIMARAFYQEIVNVISRVYLRGSSCNTLWDKIRDAPNIKGVMDEELNILYFYEEGALPGLEDKEYSTLKNIFIDILREYTRDTGSFKDRCSKLALSYWRDGNEEHKPINNEFSLYKVLEDDFSWENGPEVR